MKTNYSNFVINTDMEGICRVILNAPGKPMNVLNESVMRELESIVSDLEQVSDTGRPVQVVSFESSKESGFLAGADVSVIQTIDSREESDRLIQAGQNLFERIERLTMTTVTIIHGPCLGGGLELALACDYRVARDNSSTQIGLPEIKLGVIPGWGGTQRLPSLIGTPAALKLILQGKLLSAADALRYGVVDRTIAPDNWAGESADVLMAMREGTFVRRMPKRKWIERILDSNWFGRGVIFHQARKSIRGKVRHYPALASAIRAIEVGYSSRRLGYEREREEFGKLLQTPTSRNLIQLFFSREAARKPATWTDVLPMSIHDHPIRKVGVIGGGAMGAGIAMLAATRGFEVVIKELHEGAADAAAQRIEKLIDERAKHKRLSESDRDELSGLIEITTTNTALVDCDLYVEAVVERMDVKQAVFQDLCKRRHGEAILASNTSSLSIAEMASVTPCAEKVAGLHFFNPVHRMELVEVVRGKDTDDATVARLVGFVRALGKTPIVTSDSPGFLVNRILFPYLGEAIRMVSEGYAVDQIDRHMRHFGMPMGPLELLDHVGIDVAYHVAKTLDSTLPEARDVIESLKAMVDDGRLGVKSGIGFYDHRGAKKMPIATRALHTPGAENRELVPDGLDAIMRRLVYTMLAEAARCDEEQVVSFPWSIDLGMVLGTGFAPHLGGPMSLIKSIGADKVVTNLRGMTKELGLRFEPPKRLLEMADGVAVSMTQTEE